MVDDINPAIVIDNGSGFCKAGISGDDTPRCSIPTIVGRPKQPGLMVGMDQKDHYIGEEVFSKQNVLNISYPVDYGQIQNWEDMEKIWSHIYYNELHISADEHPVMMSEAPNNKKKNREKIMEIMFESFQVTGFFLAIQQVLALFAQGRTTGIVVDSGYSISHAVPVYEGFALNHAISEIPLAGRDLTNYLMKLVDESGKQFSNSVENKKDNAIYVKERYCYVSNDFEAEMKSFQETGKQIVCKLPDHTEIILGNQLFKCPEVLFSPMKIGKDFQGIHESTFQSIMKCDVDIRKELYANIIMSGASTMFRDINIRLQKEVAALAPSTMTPKVITPPERKYSVWIGGSVLSSLPNFQNTFITRQEYGDGGPSFVHKKCF